MTLRYEDIDVRKLMSAARGRDVGPLTDEEAEFVEELRVDLQAIDAAGLSVDLPYD